MSLFDRDEVENYKEELYRKHYEEGMRWQEIADLLNPYYSQEHTISKYKHDYFNNYYDRFVEEDQEKEDKRSLSDVLLEMKKEKVKLSDERVQTNSILRRISREETIKDIAHDFALVMNKEKIFHEVNGLSAENTSTEGILVLSDWHYGLEVKSYFNEYNTEICKERVRNLYNKVVDKCLKNNVRRLYVVNLSDLIAGRIHQTIRLQSRIDVVTQTMEVSEILAEFLHNLSNYFVIEYYDCLDNHGRIEPVKNDSLDLESLTRITKWYLKERLADNKNIHINDNHISEDIISFVCKGHKVVAVHGHKDKSSKIIDNMNSFMQDHFELVLSAHEHHFSADEKNETVRLSSGTLMGSDDFSENLRLTSQPSQLLVLVTGDNVTEDICRIVVR